MSNAIELCISYENERKLVFFQPETQLGCFVTSLEEIFGLLDKEIKLYDVNKNAEITSSLSFKMDNEIKIVVVGEKSLDNPFESVPVIESSIVQTTTISFEDILSKKFDEEELLNEVNVWANAKRFNLMASEGFKTLKNGV